MLHDSAKDDGYPLHSNEQQSTENDGDTAEGCQKPAQQHQTTGDDDDDDDDDGDDRHCQTLHPELFGCHDCNVLFKL